jgi:hypothetical protein
MISFICYIFFRTNKKNQWDFSSRTNFKWIWILNQSFGFDLFYIIIIIGNFYTIMLAQSLFMHRTCINRLIACHSELYLCLLIAFGLCSLCQQTEFFHFTKVGRVITCSQILSSWLGDIDDSSIGFSYWPAILCTLAGGYDNPMPESTIVDPPERD